MSGKYLLKMYLIVLFLWKISK